MKTKLIDSYIQTSTEINGKWYVAKPYSENLFRRLQQAFFVIIDKATAVHFKQDEN